MTFTDLQLPIALVTALEKQGITTAMPVQADAIPVVAAGKNVFIQSETGTGKTLAYLLPLMAKVNSKVAATQVVVVLPTHELALQSHKVACDLSQSAGIPIQAVLLLGGTSIDRQIDKLKKNPHFVFGTPGRILELIERGKLKTKFLKSIVVDEADRLLAGDSLDTLRAIIAAPRQETQKIYVSATEQSESAAEILKLSPDLVKVCAAAAAVNPNIEHKYLVGEDRDKPDILRKLIHASKPERAIVFVHKNSTAEIIANKLEYHGIAVVDMHRACEKNDRKIAMQKFRSGKVQIMIASDLAARGLDIAGVSHIFNLDLPSKSKDYLHRVGRAARAGAKGIAVSLVTLQELRLVRRYQADLGVVISEIGLRRGEVIER